MLLTAELTRRPSYSGYKMKNGIHARSKGYYKEVLGIIINTRMKLPCKISVHSEVKGIIGRIARCTYDYLTYIRTLKCNMRIS